MAAGNYDRVRTDAVAQVEAGAHMLDVNAGIPMADEPAIMAEAIRLVQSIVDVPICVDSSIVAALEAGLAVVEGKPLVNSVTGEEERLESVLPLVKKYRAAVIGISNDESGISHDPDARFAVAKKIVETALDYGIPKADVLIDPLVLPAGAVQGAGWITMQVTRRLREELDVNVVCGASNVSFGLPGRKALNATFLAMMIANGLTAAITNPIEPEIKGGILAADLFMGHDENCVTWITATRAAGSGGTGGSDRAARQRRREARRAQRRQSD
jgi:5-methyltetrahydrofolate--homocysteine methyltransferase